jgi:hypothetical protein
MIPPTYFIFTNHSHPKHEHIHSQNRALQQMRLTTEAGIHFASLMVQFGRLAYQSDHLLWRCAIVPAVSVEVPSLTTMLVPAIGSILGQSLSQEVGWEDST